MLICEKKTLQVNVLTVKEVPSKYQPRAWSLAPIRWVSYESEDALWQIRTLIGDSLLQDQGSVTTRDVQKDLTFPSSEQMPTCSPLSSRLIWLIFTELCRGRISVLLTLRVDEGEEIDRVAKYFCVLSQKKTSSQNTKVNTHMESLSKYHHWYVTELIYVKFDNALFLTSSLHSFTLEFGVEVLSSTLNISPEFK